MVEVLDILLPREDHEGGRMLQEAFIKQGIQVKTKTVIEHLTIDEGAFMHTYHFKTLSLLPTAYGTMSPELNHLKEFSN